MKFLLVDRIESIEPGRKIVTVKALSLAEEYLQDHFPAFPVLPGVMMLEALVQSAAWLVRVQQGFSRSIVVLKAARNIRYASFVSPGQKLRCEVEAMSIGDDLSKFKASAYVDDTLNVSGRIELRSFNLADTQKYLAAADADVIAQLREQFKLMRGPEALAAAGVGT